MRHSPLRAIARKEFIQIQRDRATIYMVFVFPLMMLVLYGFGIRYDVKSVPVTVLDRDETPQTRQYIERFAHSPYFTIKRYAKAYRDLQEDIDRGETRIVAGARCGQGAAKSLQCLGLSALIRVEQILCLGLQMLHARASG